MNRVTPSLGINVQILLERIMAIYVVLSMVELLLFPSIEVLVGIVTSLLGIFFTSQFLCKKDLLYYYPVSTISLLFYCLFFEILPLPATLMELKPITYNMRNPYETFAQLLFLQVWLILIHFVYVLISARKNYLRNVWEKCNFFVQLTASELWFLIIGSIIWYAYKMICFGLYTDESYNINSTFSIGQWAIDLFFSSYYQILFIFYFKKFRLIKGDYKIYHIIIITLSLLLFIIGIGTNMRTAAVLVFANAFFTLIVYSIYFSNLKFNIRLKYCVLAIFMMFLFIGPFQVISSAMKAVRGERAGMNAIEMINMTINANKTNRLPNSSNNNKQSATTWDERYLDSDLLNRFCSLKILDESLYHAHRAGLANSKMQERFLKMIKVQLPRVLRGKDDKAMIQSSLSDYLYVLSSHGAARLGGVKIGTLQGLGLALFGYAYPLVLIPVYIILFYMLDSFCIQKNGRVFFSIAYFVGITDYANFYTDQHYYITQFRMIIRTFWETIIFYIIGINIVKRLPILKH